MARGPLLTIYRQVRVVFQLGKLVGHGRVSTVALSLWSYRASTRPRRTTCSWCYVPWLVNFVPAHMVRPFPLACHCAVPHWFVPSCSCTPDSARHFWCDPRRNALCPCSDSPVGLNLVLDTRSFHAAAREHSHCHLAVVHTCMMSMHAHSHFHCIGPSWFLVVYHPGWTELYFVIHARTIPTAKLLCLSVGYAASEALRPCARLRVL